MPGRMFGLGLVLAGLGLLATAWLTLCRHIASTQQAGRDAALGPVRRATLVWSAPLMIAPPPFSRDGWSYAAQGMRTNLGVSPYAPGPPTLDGTIVHPADPTPKE